MLRKPGTETGIGSDGPLGWYADLTLPYLTLPYISLSTEKIQIPKITKNLDKKRKKYQKIFVKEKRKKNS